jgi:putative flippase GtrA
MKWVLRLFIDGGHHITIPKYAISGIIGAALNILLLYMLKDIVGFHYLNATFISFLSGIALAFFLHKFWTFRDNNLGRLPKQLSLYLLIAIVNLFLNMPLMYLLVEKVGLWYIYSQLVIVIALGAVSYLINNVITFKKHHRIFN